MARAESIWGSGPLSSGNETGSIEDWCAGGASEFLLWAASLSRSQASSANAEANRILDSILTPLILPAFHGGQHAVLDEQARQLRCCSRTGQSSAQRRCTYSEYRWSG